MPRPALQALFEPRSVAVYGASRQPGKLGHTLLQNVRSGGFEGSVIAVNPALGMPSLEDACDLALISVPAVAVPDAVAEYIARHRLYLDPE